MLILYIVENICAKFQLDNTFFWVKTLNGWTIRELLRFVPLPYQPFYTDIIACDNDSDNESDYNEDDDE